MFVSNGVICEFNKNREVFWWFLSILVWVENLCCLFCDNEDYGLVNGCGFGIFFEEGGRVGLLIGLLVRVYKF